MLNDPAIICADVALIPRTGRYRGFWVYPLAPTSSRSEHERFRQALRALNERLAVGDELRIALPRAHAALACEILPVRALGGDWDWMWTSTAPAVPPHESAQESLVKLDDLADAEELTAFTNRHNTRVWAQIGVGVMAYWLGLRSSAGELLAVGGAQREESGAAHLAGILTHRDHLGRGLGARITRALTQRAIADGGVSTLGVFTESAGAIRLYQRLGYRRAVAWQSMSVLRSR